MLNLEFISISAMAPGRTMVVARHAPSQSSMVPRDRTARTAEQKTRSFYFRDTKLNNNKRTEK